MTAPQDGAMAPGVAYDLPDYPEPVSTTIVPQGKARGSECRVILYGAGTKTYYCAYEGCPYAHKEWGSVFAHRAKHAKDEARGPADVAAYTASLLSQLEKSQRENVHLRAQLAEARQRAARLSNRIRAAEAAA